MTMSHEQAREQCERHGQGHVFDFWDRLDRHERVALLNQIATLDFESLKRMREMLRRPDGASGDAGLIVPAPVVTFSEEDRRRYRELGARPLAAGAVGVILVAGGQGSRLGFDGPKGAFPVGPVSNAPLFAIHARKILALEQRYRTGIPFYIMTSQANHAPTVEFFEAHDYFGLSKDRVCFFVQGMWPALDREGRVILDTPSHIFMSPDGHGGTLSALRDGGMLDDMSRRGLKTLFYFQVDNPLVEIADPAFIGIHTERNADFSVKVCAKRDPNEGVGVVVIRGGRNAVVEYTELTEEQKHAVLPDGRLKFRFGSVAIHIFSLDFLMREARAALPLHIAHKKIPFVQADGRTMTPSAPNGYKFEKFIFDAIPDADTVLNVAFDREEEFSPVKNANGPDSQATAQRDMIRKFARWFEACGIEVPRRADGEPMYRMEIDPCYARDAEELRARLPAGFRIEGNLWLQSEAPC